MTHVLHCPSCQGTDSVRHGTPPEGKQRYRCRACPDRGRTLLLGYAYAGQSPDVKQQMVDMAMNASGMRDTAGLIELGYHEPTVYGAPCPPTSNMACCFWRLWLRWVWQS